MHYMCYCALRSYIDWAQSFMCQSFFSFNKVKNIYFLKLIMPNRHNQAHYAVAMN